jgi:hypothetical protein
MYVLTISLISKRTVIAGQDLDFVSLYTLQEKYVINFLRLFVDKSNIG